MIRGIHHFGLTVRDVDASAAWYEEVLGFRRAGEFKAPDGTRRKVFLRHDGLQARLGLTQHRHGSQDAFDETRAGLDHLAFTVADRGNSTPGQRGAPSRPVAFGAACGLEGPARPDAPASRARAASLIGQVGNRPVCGRRGNEPCRLG
jgi:catechol 2,3-dioxygenase-like lactoylglutathione lyase family enzyme